MFAVRAPARVGVREDNGLFVRLRKNSNAEPGVLYNRIRLAHEGLKGLFSTFRAHGLRPDPDILRFPQRP